MYKVSIEDLRKYYGTHFDEHFNKMFTFIQIPPPGETTRIPLLSWNSVVGLTTLDLVDMLRVRKKGHFILREVSRRSAERANNQARIHPENKEVAFWANRASMLFKNHDFAGYCSADAAYAISGNEYNREQAWLDIRHDILSLCR
jgi:hypothetical protein